MTQYRRLSSDVPERPITFDAAQDLGAFELAELWADRSAWPLQDRTVYDELAELACMSALARWLTRWVLHDDARHRARPRPSFRTLATVAACAVNAPW